MALAGFSDEFCIVGQLVFGQIVGRLALQRYSRVPFERRREEEREPTKRRLRAGQEVRGGH